MSHDVASSKPLVVLGISAHFHDAAAALVIDGQVVAAIEEERLSRKKHDASLPLRAVASCLAQAGLTAQDLDHVVFYEKPLRKFERLLVGHLDAYPRALSRFSRALGTWLSDKLWVEQALAKALDIDPEILLFAEHHGSHAASAFLASPFREAAVLTVDGVGEWAASALHHGVSSETGTRLDLLAEQRYPHSLGLLYSALTAYLGFEVNEGEYKVMGLAAYGEPRFGAEFERFVTVAADGVLRLDLDYFAFHRSPTQSFSKKLVKLLGPARAPEHDFDPRTPEGRRYADIAATLQRVTEDAMLAMAREALRRTGSRNLCLAGGVALNSAMNGRLARELDVDAIYVHPAAGDAGGAVGAALWATHVLHGRPRREDVMPSCGLGPEYTSASIAAFLAESRIPSESLPDAGEMDQEIARRVARGEVGAVFFGRAEWGPRALGGRSIIASPQRAEMVDFVNTSVKFREPFRPFAPAVLAEDAETFFALDPRGRDTYLTPYMLAVVPVTERGAEALPATTHVDGTARVQVVRPREAPRFHALLSAVKAETGVGCLLNTSLNLKGEPLATSPVDAYAVFARSGLDFLVLEDRLVTKPATRASHASTQGAP